jgi:hypothetical protein
VDEVLIYILLPTCKTVVHKRIEKIELCTVYHLQPLDPMSGSQCLCCIRWICVQMGNDQWYIEKCVLMKTNRRMTITFSWPSREDQLNVCSEQKNVSDVRLTGVRL